MDINFATDKLKIFRDPGKKEAVFLPYQASMWDSLEPVWQKYAEDSEWNVRVISIPYYEKNADGSFGEMHCDKDKYPETVSLINYDEYDFEKNKPDVIYIHNPYDDINYVTSVHPFFYSSNLKKYTDRLVYIPYFVLREPISSHISQLTGLEKFVKTPGVVNADEVIVQSEMMKECYVNILTDMFGEESRAKWEKKIKGDGSPKIEKIKRLKEEGVDVPNEWKRHIYSAEGIKRKVILYNTSVNAFLDDSEDMLDKMLDTFSFFKERKNETTLLWRPHPLMINTIKSLRPELLDRYQRIVNRYIEEDIGIFDESGDLDRALVVADAYFGDDSSLVSLCQAISIPIMIQNTRVLNNETKIAYCIPTYMHPEVIEETLPIMMSIFYRFNIDIHYFDSSSDDKSRTIIEEYSAKYPNRVFYYKVSWGADEKYLNIAKGHLLDKKYDYIWIVKDRAVFYESALEEVFWAAKSKPDVIYLPVEADVSKLVQPNSGIVYNSPLEFFKDYGSASTSWETVIFNSGLLQNLDWDNLENNTPIGTDCPFNQSLILFEALYELSKHSSVRISVLNRDKCERGCSSKSQSMWLSRTVELWGEKWPQMMNMLPLYYDKFKGAVIRDGVSLPPVWGSYDTLYYLRGEDLFTIKEWDKLKPIWSSISVLPQENVDLLMSDQLEKLVYKVYNEFINCIADSDIENAYLLYLSLNAISDNLGPEASEAMENTFEIYALEHGEHSIELKEGELPFESGCTTLQNYLDKYNLVKMLVHKLNEKAAPEIIAPLLEMKNRLRISDLALKYIMKTIKF